MPDIDGLKWIRINTPEFIPIYLVKQIKQRTYDLEQFYQYQRNNLQLSTENGFIMNPFNHLWVLADPENIIQGFVWFTVDPLTKDIVIQSYSVDKAYWGKGLAVKKLAEHIKNIRKNAELNKIFWITKYPRHSEKYGFKRSKMILMEYSEEKDGSDTVGRLREKGRHQSSDATASKLSE